MLVRRAMKGEVALVAAAKRLQDELLSPAPTGAGSGGTEPLDEAARTVTALKKTALSVLVTAMQTYADRLSDEQEVLSYAADMLIDVYAAESAVLRARAAAAASHQHAALHESAATLLASDAAQRVEMAARSAVAAMAEGDAFRTLLAALRRLLKAQPVNTVALRRRLADAVVERGGYILS
jgi:hypothetical protein